MTLRELGDLITWIGGIAVAAVAIGGLFHIVAIRPLKKWILRQIADPLKQTEKSLKTSNGMSAGAYIENSSNKLDNIEKEMNNLSVQLAITSQLVLKTQEQVDVNTHIIKSHLMEDHGAKPDS